MTDRERLLSEALQELVDGLDWYAAKWGLGPARLQFALENGRKALASARDGALSSEPVDILAQLDNEKYVGPKGKPLRLTSAPAPPAGEWDAATQAEQWREAHLVHRKLSAALAQFAQDCYTAGAASTKMEESPLVFMTKEEHARLLSLASAKPITGEMVLAALQTYAPQAARLLGMQTINQIANQLQRGEK